MAATTDRVKPKLREVSFLDFWLLVSQEVGNARLVLNSRAKRLSKLIDKHSDVHPYLHEAVKTTYKQSGCQHLNSPISLAVVLDVLGDTAWQLQAKRRCDLFDIELLEEIVCLMCDRYAAHIDELVAALDDAEQQDPSSANQIISFPRYKIRKANALL